MNSRQKHFTTAQYESFKSYFEEEFEFWKDKLFRADSPEQEKSLRARNFQSLHLKHILMLYTAGEDIQSLVLPLETLIASYEELQKYLAIYEQIPHITPLIIDDWPDEYEECLQVISLCILLHRTDLLKRFVYLIDNAGYAGIDTLYEDLLSKVLPCLGEWILISGITTSTRRLFRRFTLATRANHRVFSVNTATTGIAPLNRRHGMTRTLTVKKVVMSAIGLWKLGQLLTCMA